MFIDREHRKVFVQLRQERNLSIAHKWALPVSWGIAISINIPCLRHFQKLPLPIKAGNTGESANAGWNYFGVAGSQSRGLDHYQGKSSSCKTIRFAPAPLTTSMILITSP